MSSKQLIEGYEIFGYYKMRKNSFVYIHGVRRMGVTLKSYGVCFFVVWRVVSCVSKGHRVVSCVSKDHRVVSCVSKDHNVFMFRVEHVKKMKALQPSKCREPLSQAAIQWHKEAAVEDGPVVYDKIPREVLITRVQENGLNMCYDGISRHNTDNINIGTLVPDM